MSFQESESTNLIYIEGGRHLANGGFVRNEWMPLSNTETYRNQHNNTGLYVTAYRYDSNNVETANLFGDFYLDFDNEDDFEKVRKDALHTIFYFKQSFTFNIPERFIQIYYSGKKGIHLIIPANIFGYEPSQLLNEYFKLMAEEINRIVDNNTIDTRIYDKRRLLRLENSIHQDTGLYKIPLTYDELKYDSIESIREKAKSQRTLPTENTYEIPRAKSEFRIIMDKWAIRFEKQFNKDGNKEAKPLGFTPACTQELIDLGPQKGKRNNTAAVLVSFWKGEGKSEQEAWDLLVDWNGASLTERELKNTLQSVYEGKYRYGCSTLETLATCAMHECPLWKGKKY